MRILLVGAGGVGGAFAAIAGRRDYTAISEISLVGRRA